MKQEEEIVASWNREQYLNRCRASSSISATDLALWGIVIVVLLAGCDLLLTLMKISAGNFVDDNPVAQVFIKHGMHAGLITFKVSAVTFFA
ncbi:MAG: hypothetical protein KGZ25_03595, partial [Planctomycetes bacterium]|nr:hypothetical protein [Planctomycetota bacterium]